jgi:uncharacterized membrane protein
MEHKVIYLAFIFILYSFFGWLIESIRTSIKNKKAVNRGMLNLPFVIVYGLTAIIISVASFDTRNVLLIFVGSTIYSTFMELSAGKLLEVFNKGKWWDYSNRFLNLGGYVALMPSLVWGVLGTVSFLYINPLLLKLFNLIDYNVLKISIFSILILMVIDFIVSYLSLTKNKNNKVVNSKNKINLSNEVFNRVVEAYPIINKNKNVFSKDAFNIYKFLIYLIIGGILGCMCEMVFCRFTMNQWMSRSSLLYGEISLVWGLGLALFTSFLHMYRNKSSLFIFIYGTILGTSFEYLCGSFCEFLYGYSFWSYKHLPLNINGRVQIIFALIWGFVALIYIKYVYKRLNNLLERIPQRVGKIVVTSLVLVLILDISISITAGIRFSERRRYLPPSNVVEEFCDKHYTDEYMTTRFKNLKIEE